MQVGEVKAVDGPAARHIPGRTMWSVGLRRAGVKTGLERVLAAIGLLVLAPVFLLCAMGITWASPGPVLFLQTRIGQHGKRFRIVKFRTMDRRGRAVFPFGRWLRNSSLDELPQLVNVLRGEMSLVGPRPHRVGERVGGRLLAEVALDYAARHLVRPGLTGLAQVNGQRGRMRVAADLERRLTFDLAYIETWSLALDLRILLRTMLLGFLDTDG